MHPHAGYHMKRFYQYFVRLDSDPVRSALESYMQNHRKSNHDDFHKLFDLEVGNPIGSLGVRMVHQTLASDRPELSCLWHENRDERRCL